MFLVSFSVTDANLIENSIVYKSKTIKFLNLPDKF